MTEPFSFFKVQFFIALNYNEKEESFPSQLFQPEPAPAVGTDEDPASG
jgi:hypothetical protein